MIPEGMDRGEDEYTSSLKNGIRRDSTRVSYIKNIFVYEPGPEFEGDVTRRRVSLDLELYPIANRRQRKKVSQSHTNPDNFQSEHVTFDITGKGASKAGKYITKQLRFKFPDPPDELPPKRMRSHRYW
jgi:hypothetical protein